MTKYVYCPDPFRAKNNIENFLERNPNYRDIFYNYEREIALLFSHSQFLANFSITYPEELFINLERLNQQISKKNLTIELSEILSNCKDTMKTVRIFKKSRLLHITLRDILGIDSTHVVLFNLSILAEAILFLVFEFINRQFEMKYSISVSNPLSVIALGKLGARELNYSSDVDLIFVYRDYDDELSSNQDLSQAQLGGMSTFEYYCKLIEEYTKFLSRQTDDGFVYRVDLRLRPQGQKSPLCMSLKAYEEYYESWGQLWERAALLRAIPVAGDLELGNDFINIIRPFVFRRYLDTETINSLRNMKSQVEHIKHDTLSKDIKRGYGGIREIEFFIQIFQLIYGGREHSLREKSTYLALHRLLEKKLIGHEDFKQLIDAYNFLRTLENRLQQANDLQTHSLPVSEQEMTVLAKKMGFSSLEDFLSSLKDIRTRVRIIYDSLLETNKEDVKDYGLFDNFYWDADSPIESLLRKELEKSEVKDINKAIYCLMKIKNTMNSFQTIRGRRLLDEIVPRFINEALKIPNADKALIQLVDFTTTLTNNEAYLDSVIKKDTIIFELIFLFSQSEYLSRIIMSRKEFIDIIILGLSEKIFLYKAKKEITNSTAVDLRIFKKKNELSLGIYFLSKKITLIELTRRLTITAEAILDSLKERIVRKIQPNYTDLTVIAFGKLGAREIIFNSDLDIVFITSSEPTEIDVRVAQTILRELMSYTKDGFIYKFDTRLRPDGSKGPLVISIEGLRKYYLENAKTWELQALLKARPISGNTKQTISEFLRLREYVLTVRAKEIKKEDILSMRERIKKELSRETSTHINIKLGKGGINDIEFAVQYLQLKHLECSQKLLVQSTIKAIERLLKVGVIDKNKANILIENYVFLRTIETIQRLRNESKIRIDDISSLQSLSAFFGISQEEFLSKLREILPFNDNFLATI